MRAASTLVCRSACGRRRLLDVGQRVGHFAECRLDRLLVSGDCLPLARASLPRPRRCSRPASKIGSDSAEADRPDPAAGARAATRGRGSRRRTRRSARCVGNSAAFATPICALAATRFCFRRADVGPALEQRRRQAGGRHRRHGQLREVAGRDLQIEPARQRAEQMLARARAAARSSLSCADASARTPSAWFDVEIRREPGLARAGATMSSESSRVRQRFARRRDLRVERAQRKIRLRRQPGERTASRRRARSACASACARALSTSAAQAAPEIDLERRRQREAARRCVSRTRRPALRRRCSSASARRRAPRSISGNSAAFDFTQHAPRPLRSRATASATSALSSSAVATSSFERRVAVERPPIGRTTGAAADVAVAGGASG